MSEEAVRCPSTERRIPTRRSSPRGQIPGEPPAPLRPRTPQAAGPAPVSELGLTACRVQMSQALARAPDAPAIA